MPYVISTLAQDQEYTFYKTIRDGRSIRHIPEPEKTVRIKGGQGVMEQKSLLTPDNGVVTEITDEQAELLKTHPCFLEHEKNSKVRIVNNKLNVEKTVEKHMDKEDDSAQLTPSDFGNEAAEAEAANSEVKINGGKVAAKRGSRSRKIK